MSKEDNSKKKGSSDEMPVNHHDEGHDKEMSEEKSHTRKDKKHKTDAADELNSQWQLKCDELNDKYLRLYSEFDNYRKRTQKERIEFSKTASEDIILSLLPVMDDLERALASAIKNGEGIDVIPKDGLQLIYQKFRGLLAQKGLELIPALGEPFNVDYHDALTNIPVSSEDMKGKVVDEVEKGYKLNGKVIRYSKVVVGN
jgi:molecular chaperone GrpE